MVAWSSCTYACTNWRGWWQWTQWRRGGTLQAVDQGAGLRDCFAFDATSSLPLEIHNFCVSLICRQICQGVLVMFSFQIFMASQVRPTTHSVAPHGKTRKTLQRLARSFKESTDKKVVRGYRIPNLSNPRFDVRQPLDCLQNLWLGQHTCCNSHLYLLKCRTYSTYILVVFRRDCVLTCGVWLVLYVACRRPPVQAESWQHSFFDRISCEQIHYIEQKLYSQQAASEIQSL